MLRTAVAIVNYNTVNDLEACLDSVFAGGAREVVVKDNGSTDGSTEMVARRFPAVMIHPDRGNPGYGAASNQVVAACRAEHVLLLNSDTLLERDTLAVLDEYLGSHPRVALVGPRLHNPDGSLQRSAHRFPRPMTVRPILRHIPWLRERSLLTWGHDVARPVPWVKGAALAIRRVAFDEVGGFDPAFFMYFEETDLCHRLWRAGWEVHFTPATVIIHKGGASTDHVRAEMAVQFYASMRQFYARHYPRGDLARLDAILKTTTVLMWVRDRSRLALSRRTDHSSRLAENVGVWSRIMRGDWPVRGGAAPNAGSGPPTPRSAA